MELPSKYLQRAVEEMSSLPGIGKRTALRLVLSLLQQEKREVVGFAQSFIDLIEHTKMCKTCHNISDQEICGICSNPNRDKSTICVVSDIRDIMAIENTMQYKGVYHVLGGVISPMDGIGPNDLNIDSLISRLEPEGALEVILALSATTEGDTTNFYLYKKINSYPVKVTIISRGIGVGSELEYADEVTLGRSIINRSPFDLNISN
ncbi:recombination mediator RecR [Parvicella tangerina]|uniref:Recombination protein RecR n=1 Tax=Parvicella tangerina TaxID=2829795 RepID=A0A916JNG2_9FLAO|nr:recombination mediator RecR [Parvicella tangerina]CAG5084621.1 Recombination protein RecR [Parvicella tangerina]